MSESEFILFSSLKSLLFVQLDLSLWCWWSSSNIWWPWFSIIFMNDEWGWFIWISASFFIWFYPHVSWRRVDWALCNMDSSLTLRYHSRVRKAEFSTPPLTRIIMRARLCGLSPLGVLIPLRQRVQFLSIIFFFSLGAYDPSTHGVEKSANAGLLQIVLRPTTLFSLLFFLFTLIHCLFLLSLSICCLDWNRSGKRAQQWRSSSLYWCLLCGSPRL